MQFLPLTEADKTYLKPLQPPDWKDIMPSIENYLKFPMYAPYKVVLNNEIIGLGTTILHEKTAWLAGIIVHPEHRNKGIGTEITKYLIQSLKSYNLESVLLIATDLGEPVYKKSGFETETEYVFLKGEKMPESNYDKNIIPIKNELIKSVLDLDKEVFDENRFASLERHLTKGYVYEKNNKIEGLYLPTFGEGLILATNENAGKALMNLRCQKINISVLPVDNECAIDFLVQQNYTVLRKAKRMRLGKKRNFKPKYIYSRVNGQIG